MTPIQARSIVVRRDLPLPGQVNMAIDEAMLSEARPDSPITIRLYQWDQPTLSLGHFQSIEHCAKDVRISHAPKLRAIPWVRRKTGGGAILHDREWTYSFVVPENTQHGGKGHSEAFYRSVHESIRDGLVALGWNAMLAEHCTCSPMNHGENEPFLCFHRRSPVDIVVGENKVVGSAQRRSRNGLLQHGSILAKSSLLFAEVPGLEELRVGFHDPIDWPVLLEGWICKGLRSAMAGDHEDS
jgi:lipoate-protein ligase A